MTGRRNERNEPMNRLDAATSVRLAKLGAMPVDVSRLQAKLRRAMGNERPVATMNISRRRRAWRPVAGIAAMFVAAGLIGWLVVSGGSQAVIAAPAELAQLHEQAARDVLPMMRATSVDEANTLLAEQLGGSKPLPNQMPGRMHACCLRQFAGTTLSCVMIEWKGKMVSVAVADADHLRSPPGRTVERGGRRFTLHRANGVNMVMAGEHGRWLCVMGDAGDEDLLDIAAGIRF
ncbi:MAG: hypothetical protein ACYC26_03250 [Phycisphaerales bacterium]